MQKIRITIMDNDEEYVIIKGRYIDVFDMAIPDSESWSLEDLEDMDIFPVRTRDMEISEFVAIYCHDEPEYV